MNLNSIRHEGESSYQKEFQNLKTPSFRDGWQNIKLPDPPENDSTQTKREVKYLIELILSNTAKTISDIGKQDRTTPPFEMDFIKIINKNTKTMREWIYDISAQLFKICLHFKKKYNRPRPYKIAKALNLDYPDVAKSTQTGDTAAYPSGHTLNSYFIATVLGELYPEYKKDLFDHAAEVAKNRMKAGVHYPSDVKAGKILAEKLYKYYKKPTKLDFKEWLSS